eukprot:750623-Rhodomonas_salina.2
MASDGDDHDGGDDDRGGHWMRKMNDCSDRDDAECMNLNKTLCNSTRRRRQTDSATRSKARSKSSASRWSLCLQVRHLASESESESESLPVFQVNAAIRVICLADPESTRIHLLGADAIALSDRWRSCRGRCRRRRRSCRRRSEREDSCARCWSRRCEAAAHAANIAVMACDDRDEDEEDDDDDDTDDTDDDAWRKMMMTP